MKWPASAPDRLTLLVVGEGTSTSHTLPSAGEVVLGRGEQADIRIDDASISRKHAKLHIGNVLAIEDLGSANGTVVRSTALQPGQKVEIQPGVAVEIGGTVVIVQAPAGARTPRARNHSVRPRRLMTHGYFEVRLEEACAQADASRGKFGVLRVHLDRPEADERAPELLVEALRPIDLVASYGPSEYEVMVADATPQVALEAMDRIRRVFAAESITVRLGVACYPVDGRTPETLMERAHAGARGGDAGLESTRGRRLVVQDRVMVRLHRLIERIAQGNISVLLLGETGVGKEVLAEAVHKASPRADKPFVKLNCAALTESLFESELFGHEKGSFTGALKTKPGLLETADGGTLFLDEVGEIPMSIQAKLLRVIEERKVLRVGALAPHEVDVRFVSATNRNLEEEVARGRFRQDLFYRLNGIALVVPPLRERVSEVEDLAVSFAAAAAKSLGARSVPTISAEAMALFKSYSWPGNIRELRNVIERAVLLAGEDDIVPEHLPVEKMGGTVVGSRVFGAVQAGSGDWPSGGGVEDEDDEHGDWGGEDTLESSSPLRPRTKDEVSSWEAERQRIIEALDRCAGNQSQAAKLLGMSRRTLVTRLVTHRIPRPRKPLPEA